MSRNPANDAVEEFKQAQAALLRQFHSRAESRYINLTAPALRTHVLEGGSGEPVILLHRGAGLAVGWQPLLSALEAHFHVFAPDNPGCGLSEKINFRGIDFRQYIVDFLTSLFDALGVSRAALIGNSTGAYYALVFALAHPERVSKLVLVGAPAGIDHFIPRFIRLLGIRGINRLLLATVLSPSPESTQALFRTMLVANMMMVPRSYLYASYVARKIPGAEFSWLTMLEQLVTLKGFRPRYYIGSELARIEHPILFVWGEKDWFAPPSIGDAACRTLKKGRIVVLKDAGHLPWLDEPRWTAELIIEFLKENSSVHTVQE
jgi:pimeloyl-ACP methyl ester carboxylesterase